MITKLWDSGIIGAEYTQKDKENHLDIIFKWEPLYIKHLVFFYHNIIYKMNINSIFKCF